MILRVKHGVNYSLWVIMMCQCTLNKRTTAVRDVDSGAGYACAGQGLCGKSLYLPLSFAVNLKSL